MKTLLTCGNEPPSEAALLSYLSSEAEATSGGHHLLQDVAPDSSSADVFVDDAVLQMDVVYGHAHQRQLAGEGRFAQQVVCQGQSETIIMSLTQTLTSTLCLKHDMTSWLFRFCFSFFFYKNTLLEFMTTISYSKVMILILNQSNPSHKLK